MSDPVAHLRVPSVDDGTCWNCKHYADYHEYAYGSCTRITEDSGVVHLDAESHPSSPEPELRLEVVHDFGCRLYEYRHNDKSLRHPPPLLESMSNE